MLKVAIVKIVPSENSMTGPGPIEAPNTTNTQGVSLKTVCPAFPYPNGQVRIFDSTGCRRSIPAARGDDARVAVEVHNRISIGEFAEATAKQPAVPGRKGKR